MDFFNLNLAELSLHAAYFIKKWGPPVFYAEHRRPTLITPLGLFFYTAERYRGQG